MQDKIYYRKQDNGFVNIIRESSGKNAMMVLVLTIKVGSLYDDKKLGISHYIEHCNMIFDRNNSIKNKDSLFVHASTDYYSTSYYFQILMNDKVNETINETFQIIQNIISGKYLQPDIMDQITKDIQYEYDNKKTNKEYLMLKKYFQNTSFKDQDPIGVPEIFNHYSYNDLIDFYTKYYHSDNMGITIVCNTHIKDLTKRIAKLVFQKSINCKDTYPLWQLQFPSKIEIIRNNNDIYMYRFLKVSKHNKYQYLKEVMILDIILDLLQLTLNCDCKNTIISEKYTFVYFDFHLQNSMNDITNIDMIEKIVASAEKLLNSKFYELINGYIHCIQNIWNKTGMHEKSLELTNHYIYNTPLISLNNQKKMLSNIMKHITVESIMDKMKLFLDA